MQSTSRLQAARAYAEQYRSAGRLPELAHGCGVNYWTLRKFLSEPDRELRASSVDAILAHKAQMGEGEG